MGAQIPDSINRMGAKKVTTLAREILDNPEVEAFTLGRAKVLGVPTEHGGVKNLGLGGTWSEALRRAMGAK